MRLRRAVAALGVNALVHAAIVTGTVRNGTTGKPAAGDEVVLISAGNRPTEIGRGRTDDGGAFRFIAAEVKGLRLVQVLHHGVTYHTMAPSGVHSLHVEVYDHATNLDGVTAARDVQRFQTEGDTLQVLEEIVMRNASSPPRTLLNERTFEIHLPPEAEVVAGRVQTGGGQRLTRMPGPGDRKGHYYFSEPLRPGETRFALAYRLPYAGQAWIEPRIVYPVQRFVVVLPQSMRFEAKVPGVFRAEPGQGSTTIQIQESTGVKPGQTLGFRLSGTGTLAPGETGLPGSGRVPAASPRLPDRLASHGCFMLGVLVVFVAGGAAGLIARRRRRRLALE